MTAGNEGVDNITADKPGPANHCYSHACIINDNAPPAEALVAGCYSLLPDLHALAGRQVQGVALAHVKRRVE